MRLSNSLLLSTASLLCSVDASDLIRSHTKRGTSNFTSTLVATQYGTVFDAPMVIGNQTFQMMVDTGSSDTYVMGHGFDCIDKETNMVIPEGKCRYSKKTYHTSRTHRHVPGQMFGIQYGDGIATGEMAYEDVTLNGIKVKGQKIGVGNSSTPMGDGVNSGLLGLGYPSLTSAHPANHSSNETYWYDRITYNPLMYTMHKRGLVDPYFSLALARTPQNTSTGFGGYMTLGGLPPVPHNRKFTKVPVEIIKDIPHNFTSDKRTRSYWASTISGFTYGTSSDNLTTESTDFQFFLDSGNFIQYLPAKIVDPINALFDPPPVIKDGYDGPVVDCSAKPPQFGLTIGDQTFFHSGEDLIYRTSDGTCITSLVSSESVQIADVTLNIIGVPFLKNVVAVFDFGKDEMRFSKLEGANATSEGTGADDSPAFSLGSKSIQENLFVATAMTAFAILVIVF